MDEATFVARVEEDFGITLDAEQQAQFRDFLALLRDWNEKINLTAITEPGEIYTKHFYDSLTAAQAVAFDQQTLLDVGGGAGFPAIPLKIAFPNLNVTVIDSLKKRVDFVNLAVETLGLAGITALHGRAETLGRDAKQREHYDVVTARAVARLSILAEYCLPFVRVGGVFLAMKGSHVADELAAGETALQKLGGDLTDDLALTLPEDGGERHLLTIVKHAPTPKRYPRKPGTPKKQPLGESN